MVGTELAVSPAKGMRPPVRIDLNNLQFGGVKNLVDKYINAVGGSTGGGSRFPGQQIGFKKGIWSKGYKDGARIAPGTKFVFNAPNMIAGWRTFDENESGTMFPNYSDMAMPFANQDLVTRDTLGKDDQQEWDEDSSGNKLDPWSPILVFPVREDADDASYDHVLLSTKSSCIAGFNLFAQIIEELKARPGQLPVIALGSDKAEREVKTVDKKGREKKEKFIWDVPTFTIVGWVMAEDVDDAPNAGGVQVTDDSAAAELGNVTAKARVAIPAPEEKKAEITRKRVRKTAKQDDDTL